MAESTPQWPDRIRDLRHFALVGQAPRHLLDLAAHACLGQRGVGMATSELEPLDMRQLAVWDSGVAYGWRLLLEVPPWPLLEGSWVALLPWVFLF